MARLRPDRLITLKVVQPCRRLAARLGWLRSRAPSPTRCLPVLMYHSIAEELEAGVPAYYQTATRPDVFAGQMVRLKAGGFQGVDLATGLAWLHATGPDSPAHPVAITFDDGFRDFLTDAFPVLQRERFTATMYLPTAFIAGPGGRRSFKGRECLTWSEVRQLGAAGMEFGSHTVNHPRLVELSPDRVRAELADSKSEIEQQLGIPVPSFAYPYAFPNGNRAFAWQFCDWVAAAGYQNCVTTQIGRVVPGDDLYTLKRLPVNSLDDAALLGAKVQGDYDWLGRAQAVIKALKHWGGRAHGA